MESYKSDGSSIESYEIHQKSIAISFRTGGVYIYNQSTIGEDHVQNLCALALSDRGLNTYINENENVKNHFTEKFLDVETYQKNFTSPALTLPKTH